MCVTPYHGTWHIKSDQETLVIPLHDDNHTMRSPLVPHKIPDQKPPLDAHDDKEQKGILARRTLARCKAHDRYVT